MQTSKMPHSLPAEFSPCCRTRYMAPLAPWLVQAASTPSTTPCAGALHDPWRPFTGACNDCTWLASTGYVPHVDTPRPRSPHAPLAWPGRVFPPARCHITLAQHPMHLSSRHPGVATHRSRRLKSLHARRYDPNQHCYREHSSLYEHRIQHVIVSC